MNSRNECTLFAGDAEDKMAIDLLVRDFFMLFSVPAGIKADLSAIYKLFIPEGIIIKNVGEQFETYTLQQFIAPREELFDSGTLKDFKEEELFEKTDIFGNIAQRLCLYKKTGLMNGTFFQTHGVKSLQFVKTVSGWRLSALIWDDEREGLTVSL
jgi:hypothetical protein